MILSVLYAFIYFIYVELGDIFIFLPPLLGVLFIYYLHARERHDIFNTCVILALLLLIEVDKDMVPFSLVALFFICEFLSRRLLEEIFTKALWLQLAYVVLVYIMLFLEVYILDFIFPQHYMGFGLSYLTFSYLIEEIAIAALILLRRQDRRTWGVR